MPGLADSFALCAVAAALAGTLTLVTRRWLQRNAMWLFFAALWVALLVPLGALPLAGYIRGMVGDPSISLLVLIGAHLFGPPPPPGTPDRRTPFLMIVSAGALVLYPLALGAGAIDPYRWGYDSPWLVTFLLVLGLVAHLLRWPWVLAAISFAIIAWSLGVYESRNLWDYLLDPLLALYALLATARCLVNSARRNELTRASKAE